MAMRSIIGIIIPKPQSTSSPSGPPTSSPSGPPPTNPSGPPTSNPTGPPASSPSGPPTSNPTGPPTTNPTGPPTSSPSASPTSSSPGPPKKRQKIKEEPLVDDNPIRLESFMKWAKDASIQLNPKVSGSCDEMSANLGMVADDNISKGECLFTIPRSAVLSVKSSSISDLLLRNEEKLSSQSGWIPLILALMYEKHKTNSYWAPYLNAFPNFKDNTLPMFWTEKELDKNLRGTGMLQSLSVDIRNMRKEFSSIVIPFMEEHKSVFRDPIFKDFRFYKETVAFIMAYSFTDEVSKKSDEEDDDDSSVSDEDRYSPPTTIMVPMADLLNHSPVHNAVLKFGEDSLTMEAIKNIKKGEEIYNTYGQVSNYTLLLMYGFTCSPEENPYDSVQIRLSTIKSVCKSSPPYSADSMELRWKILKSKGVTDQDSICLHRDGLTDDNHIINVLQMSEREVKVASEQIADPSDKPQDEDADNRGWISDEEEDLDLSFGEVRTTLTSKFHTILSRAVTEMLNELPENWRKEIKGGDHTRLYYSKLLQGSQVLLLEKLMKYLPKR